MLLQHTPVTLGSPCWVTQPESVEVMRCGLILSHPVQVRGMDRTVASSLEVVRPYCVVITTTPTFAYSLVRVPHIIVWYGHGRTCPIGCYGPDGVRVTWLCGIIIMSTLAGIAEINLLCACFAISKVYDNSCHYN